MTIEHLVGALGAALLVVLGAVAKPIADRLIAENWEKRGEIAERWNAWLHRMVFPLALLVFATYAYLLWNSDGPVTKREVLTGVIVAIGVAASALLRLIAPVIRIIDKLIRLHERDVESIRNSIAGIEVDSRER